VVLVVVVVVVENGGGIGGVMEKRRIVRGLVSAVRHVLCLCPVFFLATACLGRCNALARILLWIFSRANFSLRT